jgi:hypothetical protein
MTFGTVSIYKTDSAFYIMYLAKYDSSGNVLWVKSFGGSLYDYVYAIAIDASGNIYIAGNFQSPTITFGTTTLTNVSGHDVFLVKLNSSGTVIWARSAQGSSTATYNFQTTALTADNSGNVIITGYFDSSITFGSQRLVNTHYAGSDIFIAKYDGSGNLLWAESSIGMGGGDASAGLATDASANIYVTGSFTSTLMSFDGVSVTNGGGGNNMFVAKFTTAGSPVWAEAFGDSTDVSSEGIATDASGNIFVTGGFDGATVTFGTTTLTNASTPGMNYNDIFLVKFNNSGDVIWAKSAGGTNEDIAQSIAVSSSGDVYISGMFQSPSITFGSDTLDNFELFVVKYNTNGTVIWAKGGSNINVCFGNSLSLDDFGHLYVAGNFSGTVTLDGNTLTDSLSPYHSYVFVAKYDNVVSGVPTINTVHQNLKLYPNPARNEITINFNNPTEISAICILDIFGRQVYELLSKSKNNQSLNIKLPDLRDGIYYIRTIATDGTDCIPFVVKRE